MFKTDPILQYHIHNIYNAGRKDDLLAYCDNYHFEFASIKNGIEWGIDFGEFIGKHHFGSEIYKFELIDGKTSLYFIGDHQIVSEKIFNLL